MNAWHICAIGLLVAVTAFWAGRSSGLRDCPEYAAYRQAATEAADRDIAALLAEPGSHDAACDAIFGIVEDELHQRAIGVQSDMARRPDPVGE